jgi:hypothetical protein
MLIVALLCLSLLIVVTSLSLPPPSLTPSKHLTSSTARAASATSIEQQQQQQHFFSLRPGSAVLIEVSSVDASAPKKRWKKRRWSSSPLLVPARIVSLNLVHAFTDNIANCIDKYGRK